MEHDRSNEDNMLLEFLHERDAACPRCGYNLRNLSRPLCPECRQYLELCVRARDITHFFFLASLAPGFFCGILAGIMFVAMAINQPGSPPIEVFLILLGFITSGSVAVVIAANRRRFLKMTNQVQFIIALSIWAVHVAAFFIFISYVS